MIATPIVALVTPFTSQGRIDWPALADYLQALAVWGVQAIITNGTTGEFASLSLDERQQITAFVRRHFPGRIINNISATGIADAYRLRQGSAEMADTVLALPPYYYANADEAGLLAFFTAVLKDCPLPVYLYHLPRHAGNEVSLSLIEALRTGGCPIVGVKDSSGNLQHALSYKALGGLEVYLGNDALALAALRQGLDGTVTGAANALPEFLLWLYRYRTDAAAAEAIQNRFDRWNRYREALNIAEIPLVKASLTARLPGFPRQVRPPFVALPKPMAGAIADEVRTGLQALQTLAGTIGPHDAG